MRRSGQYTSGASNSTVNPVVRVISPNTRRSPIPTAISATPRVASNSSTRADRKAIRSVAMAERRCAAASSAMRCSGPAPRPNARRVGIPAIRSSSRACRVVIAARAAAERSRVASPISTMKTGISGSVIATIAVDFRS